MTFSHESSLYMLASVYSVMIHNLPLCWCSSHQKTLCHEKHIKICFQSFVCVVLQKMGLSLSAAIKADQRVYSHHLDDFRGFSEAHCKIEDGVHTQFYTLCSAFNTYLRKVDRFKAYTRYDFPGQVRNLLMLYELDDPRVKCRGFTQGYDIVDYSGLTVWNVGIVSFPGKQ